MKRWLSVITILPLIFSPRLAPAAAEEGAPAKTVYILPIQENIMPPLTYLVRRGVKEAMEANADLLLLDMATDGGRVDVTIEIIKILNQFRGETVTYVNDRAFSAGAFISVATQKIYMAPQSVIGAAAPIMMSPGGTGAEEMSGTMEAKTVSALSALVRANAEKNGHNTEVVQAMIDKTRELTIDGKVLNEKGSILTLTNLEAEEEYGDPPQPLLSRGTVSSLDELLEELGYAGAKRVHIEPLGAERLAFWINAISPILLIIGVVGIYIEIKTPGFGLPGIVGIVAFAIYFLGGYVAGLAGLEWMALFVVGLALVILEIFVFPGTIVLGVTGAALMLLTIIMAMVDIYPGMPKIPTMEQLRVPLNDLLITLAGSALLILLLSRWLPKTSLYHQMVSQTSSGVVSVLAQEERQTARVGQIGVTISNLRPGGKAQFGEEIIDVVSQGELISAGQKVRIIGHSAYEAVVEPVRETAPA